mmetsp:Transcript_24049/g.58980  ORF Transcript_24049/g.58980 Transcript_24049/m.58980 type:complete len:501 (+) Transcript_24049:109-1611(+)
MVGDNRVVDVAISKIRFFISQRRRHSNESHRCCCCLHLGGVDPHVGVRDVHEYLVGVERVLGAVIVVVAEPATLAQHVAAEGMDELADGGGGEAEARGGDGRLGHPGVVRGKVLLHRVLRDLRHLVARVALAADHNDGAVRQRHRRLVAARRGHGRLGDPSGHGHLGVQLKHGVVEAVGLPCVRGVVVAAEGVHFVARGGARDVAAGLGEVRGLGPHGGGRRRVHHLDGLQRGVVGGETGHDVNLAAGGGGAGVAAGYNHLGAVGPGIGGDVVDQGGVELIGAIGGKTAHDEDLAAGDRGAVAHALLGHLGQRRVLLQRGVVHGEGVEPDSRVVEVSLSADQVHLVAHVDGGEVRGGGGEGLLGGPKARAVVEGGLRGVASHGGGGAHAEHDLGAGGADAAEGQHAVGDVADVALVLHAAGGGEGGEAECRHGDDHAGGGAHSEALDLGLGSRQLRVGVTHLGEGGLVGHGAWRVEVRLLVVVVVVVEERERETLSASDV